MTGFVMMAVFAFALSLPLLPLSIVPSLADWLRPRRWLLGAIFVGLGIWSVWFGIFVEPINWSGI